jgi:predicted GNAT superfamily acetyltransferase
MAEIIKPHTNPLEDPTILGFKQLKEGQWLIERGFVPIMFERIDWTGALRKAYGQVTFLDFIAELQKEVWGMEDRDVVPPNVLSIISKTGGSIIIAYDQNVGFNPEGWQGFVFGFGSNKGELVSHMMGVRADQRGQNVGYFLKILQGHEALKQGYEQMSWTYDPMRGINAALNLRKLGGIIDDFYINFYGNLETELYGRVPTDRVVLKWRLKEFNPEEIQRRNSFFESIVDTIPGVDSGNVNQLMNLEQKPQYLKFEIPGDIDQLMKSKEEGGNPELAIEWRKNMRIVFSSLLNTYHYDKNLGYGVKINDGLYRITGFISQKQSDGSRRNYYIFELK